MLIVLPAIESLNAFSFEDVVGGSEEIGLLLSILQTTDLLGFELDDGLDHIDWLDHGGGKHT